MQVSGWSVAFLFNEGATVVSCIMKLIHGNSPICTKGYSSPKNANSTWRSVRSTGMHMAFTGELGRQNAASHLQKPAIRLYFIRAMVELGLTAGSVQQKLRATRQRLTDEIAGWTANSPTLFFQKPACLFQLDHVSKTYSCPFISFSGNLCFRSRVQSRQILKCILRH